ncbi:MAG: hypothetical protein U7M05_12020, partial [Candidatus Igneacidithiobacillus chanchocoensis]
MISTRSTLVRVALAALVGWAAIGHGMVALGFAAALPAILFAGRPSRRIVFASATAYYAAAARASITGAASFFPHGGLVVGICFWSASSLVLGASWSFIGPSSSSPRRSLIWRLPLIYVVQTLPPLGLIAWASPLAAAGIFFPGAGITGVFALVIMQVLALLLALPDIAKSARYAIGALALCAVLLNATTTPPPAPRGWIGIDTHYVPSPGLSLAAVEHNYRLAHRAKILAAHGYTHILLPELAAGRWLVGTKIVWTNAVSQMPVGTTVYLGAQ